MSLKTYGSTGLDSYPAPPASASDDLKSKMAKRGAGGHPPPPDGPDRRRQLTSLNLSQATALYEFDSAYETGELNFVKTTYNSEPSDDDDASNTLDGAADGPRGRLVLLLLTGLLAVAVAAF